MERSAVGTQQTSPLLLTDFCSDYRSKQILMSVHCHNTPGKARVTPTSASRRNSLRSLVQT